MDPFAEQVSRHRRGLLIVLSSPSGAGKTSLINAMIGAPNLLPTDVNPWTSVVTSLHINTPSPELNVKAKFKFFDNAEWEKLVSNGGRIGQHDGR